MFQANIRFFHQDQNITPDYMLLVLWDFDLCVPVFYIKQLENPRGSQPSRPDAAHLGLLQGVKCEITEVLMRTRDTS